MSQEYFPLPDERIALIDLDQTCIDQSYVLRDKQGFCDAIKSTQEAGWKIGISSDTSLQTINDWAVEWELTGPHIAEKGSVVEVDGNVYYDLDKSNIFRDLNQRAKKHFIKSGAIVWSGDPVAFLRNNNVVGSPGDTVVLVNEYRLCSMGIFVRRVADDNTLCIEETLTTEFINQTRNLYSGLNEVDEDIAHDYGLLILSENGVEKRKGTIQLQKIMSLGRIAMIGNSMSDYLGHDVALHYAVGNAYDNFKEVANYTANQNLSRGVIEILNKLRDSSQQ